VGKRSAGLLLFRRSGRTPRQIEVLLVHPGGPFWKNKDAGAWSIPKGLIEDREDPLAAARREFQEETGIVTEGDFLPLGEARQSSAKTVIAWAVEQDIDPEAIRSNTCSVEWPPKSQQMIEFPEIDRAGWFDLDAALIKILSGQTVFLDRLKTILAASLETKSHL